MRITACLCVLGVILISVLPITAEASGGLGGRGGFGDGLSNVPATDPAYEQGKAIFKGRIKAYGKVKYCLSTADAENGLVKIKKKSIKLYKEKTAQTLADALRFCEGNTAPVTEVLTRDDLIYLMYYLNKRYRLRLT